MTSDHVPGEFLRALTVSDVAVLGRTLEGSALRWDKPYRVSDDGGRSFYREGWRRGAFVDALQATGNVHEVRLDHHDIRVGRVSFAESDSGLDFTAAIDGTEEGDAVLSEAAAGRMRSVSLRFISKRQKRHTGTGVIWRTKAIPRELSVLMNGAPQYGSDAEVVMVRSVQETAALLARARKALSIDVYSL